MEEQSNKRQRTGTSSSSACSPIVHLNVGGTPRSIRRSLLTSLRDASSSNPLCERLLSHATDAHWTALCQDGIVTDNDGIVRLYVDRNVDAFDDLLGYIEYGVKFIKHICKHNEDEGGLRLHRLQNECDCFTIESFGNDLECVLPREDVLTGTRDYVKLSAKCKSDASNNWNSLAGNESLLSKGGKRGLSMARVQTGGMYLVFFSLHSEAVNALLPDHGYINDDEFGGLGVLHNGLTSSERSDLAYLLIRCGAFDYRPDVHRRKTDPYVFTAAAADLISLQKGNEIYCQHGHGVIMPNDRWPMSINQFIASKSVQSPELQECSYMTFIKVSGCNISRFNVRINSDDDEPTKAQWESVIYPCQLQVTTTSIQ